MWTKKLDWNVSLGNSVVNEGRGGEGGVGKGKRAKRRREEVRLATSEVGHLESFYGDHPTLPFKDVDGPSDLALFFPVPTAVIFPTLDGVLYYLHFPTTFVTYTTPLKYSATGTKSSEA